MRKVSANDAVRSPACLKRLCAGVVNTALGVSDGAARIRTTRTTGTCTISRGTAPSRLPTRTRTERPGGGSQLTSTRSAQSKRVCRHG